MCCALLWGVFLISCGQPGGKDQRVVSPDGTVAMQVHVADGRLGYTVVKDGTVVLDSSVLQWSVDSTLLGSVVSKIERLATRRVQDSFPVCGIHDCSRVDYTSTGFRIAGARDFFVDVRVYNDGVAFRYRIAPGEGEYVLNDSTTFTLPQGVSTWGQDNVSYYENENVEWLADTLPVGLTFGSPLTVKYQPQDLYASITEGGLTDFAGMGLEVTPNHRTLRAKLAGETRLACGADGELTTPWRVVLIGDLNTLVNSGIIGDVSPAPDPGFFPLSVRGCGEGNGRGADWVRPGRALWSWLADNGPVSLDNMKRFSKWAGELGFEYNLVDAGWSNWKDQGRDPWAMIRELVDYSTPLGVKIWVWKAYPDDRGVDGIQTPERLQACLKKCREAGVAGVKIDYFYDESQQVVRFYEDALKEAAKYQLMIDFHGADKPTGLNRTFPNELTREGIRGLEIRGPWATHNTILPFTRYLAGPADFTPVTFSSKRLSETSWCHQVATAVIFTSPFLCYGVDPEQLLANPACDMVKSIPAVWDETIVLPGSEIGQMALFARRKGDVWFVAGISNSAAGAQAVVDLTFLGDGGYRCDMLSDDPASQQALKQHTSETTQAGELSVGLNVGGGFVARLTPVKE